MSRQLLNELNGIKRGQFHRFLDTFEGEPRIAWYPSAGMDFRDLLYLHPNYARTCLPTRPEPEPPDIFLHSDYGFGVRPFWLFPHHPVVHDDGHTRVSARTVEQLPALDLPLDPAIVDHPEITPITGHVAFVELEVCSDTLGPFCIPLIYVVAENEALCARKILPCGGQISHVIHVRYGAALGGGRATGGWLLNVLPTLKCKMFITDSYHELLLGDEAAVNLYPALGQTEHDYQFECIRHMQWSQDDNAAWNLVIPA